MCEYCEKRSPLDSVAAKWLFDEEVDVYLTKIAFGGVIMPDQKQLALNVVTSPVVEKEILVKRIDIKYCPMCGREV